MHKNKYCFEIIIEKLWKTCCHSLIDYDTHKKNIIGNYNIKNSKNHICKECCRKIFLYDIHKELYKGIYREKGICINCATTKGSIISLTCEHAICKDCIYTRYIYNDKEQLQCNICWKNIDLACCSCEKPISDKDIYESQCTSPLCQKVITLIKSEDYKGKSCSVCHTMNGIITNIYNCEDHFICWKCLKYPSTNINILFLSSVPTHCRQCKQILSKRFLYLVKSFCVIGREFVTKYLEKHYPSLKKEEQE